MKRTSLLVLALGATTLAACGGLKEAFTAHVDVVAKAGSQELSVTRLGDLLGNAKLGVPVNKEVATLVARDLWVPYQLLGARRRARRLAQRHKAIDAAAAGMIENARLGGSWRRSAAKFAASTPAPRQATSQASGGLYAARHILFIVPEGADARGSGLHPQEGRRPSARRSRRRTSPTWRASTAQDNTAQTRRRPRRRSRAA